MSRTPEQIHRQKVGAYKRKITAQLKEKGLRNVEILLEHIESNEKADFSALGICRVDALEVIKEKIKSYKEDLAN